MLKFIPFVPKLYGDYQRHFYDAAEKICKCTPSESIEQIIKDEISWAEDLLVGDLFERKKYRAVWLFLRDLLRAAWQANFNNNVLELTPPNLEDSLIESGSLVAKKFQLRQWMSESRDERVYDYKDFIYKMENQDKNGERISFLDAEHVIIKDN